MQNQFFPDPPAPDPQLLVGQDVDQRSMQLRHLTSTSLQAGPHPYLDSVIHNSSDYYGCQAESDEAVLHVLHHSGEDDQVGVERFEDGSVYVSSLKTGKSIAIKREEPDKMWLLLCFSNLF